MVDVPSGMWEGDASRKGDLIKSLEKKENWAWNDRASVCAIGWGAVGIGSPKRNHPAGRCLLLR